MRESEFDWFANHPEIMKQYREEYVAIIGERVVATRRAFETSAGRGRKG